VGKARKRIALKDAREGMVLAESVLSGSGVVLVAQGTVLSRALIEAIERKGIAQVFIEEEAACEWSAADLEAMQASVEGEVAARFRERPSGALMEAIARAALSVEARKRLKGGANR